MPWIQLLKQYRFPDATGKRKPHFPGDIVFLPNKKMAKELAAAKTVALFDISDNAPEGTGVLWRSKGDPPGWVAGMGLLMRRGKFSCPFENTVVLGSGAKPHAALLLLALEQFVKVPWDIAVPLLSYRKLAEDVGTAGERERTKQVIHDLRTPLYATDLVLLKKTPTVLDFLADFKRESADGAHEGLAFLRALYRSECTWWPLQKELRSGKR